MTSSDQRPSAGLTTTAGRWVRDDRALWRRVGPGVAVLPADATEPLVVSGCGYFLWNLLAQPASVDDLVAVAVDLFGVQPEGVEREIADAVERLAAAGALRPAA